MALLEHQTSSRTFIQTTKFEKDWKSLGFDDEDLKKNTVVIVPVKEYTADEVKSIRKSTGMSQKLFAKYMGVSGKTVEAWEEGVNHPSGSSSRILSMIETDKGVVNEFPFVKIEA